MSLATPAASPMLETPISRFTTPITDEVVLLHGGVGGASRFVVKSRGSVGGARGLFGIVSCDVDGAD